MLRVKQDRLMKKTEEKAKTGLWRIIKTRPEHKRKAVTYSPT
jgi:hypothetical protein